MAKSAKLKNFIRGDSRTLVLTFTNADGTAFDLTGCSVFFTVKPKTDPSITAEVAITDDSTALITSSVTSIPNPTLGIADITLTPTQTTIAPGDYYYDIQLVDSGGAVTSSIFDTITFLPDITRRIV